MDSIFALYQTLEHKDIHHLSHLYMVKLCNDATRLKHTAGHFPWAVKSGLDNRIIQITIILHSDSGFWGTKGISMPGVTVSLSS